MLSHIHVTTFIAHTHVVHTIKLQSLALIDVTCNVGARTRHDFRDSCSNAIRGHYVYLCCILNVQSLKGEKNLKLAASI